MPNVSFCVCLPLFSRRASVQQTLRELGVDQLDLLLLHWPEAWLPGSDPTGEVHPDTSVTLMEAW
jgi:diketogulonate reductase-like aldo/keto reductase